MCTESGTADKTSRAGGIGIYIYRRRDISGKVREQCRQSGVEQKEMERGKKSYCPQPRPINVSFPSFFRLLLRETRFLDLFSALFIHSRRQRALYVASFFFFLTRVVHGRRNLISDLLANGIRYRERCAREPYIGAARKKLASWIFGEKIDGIVMCGTFKNYRRYRFR